MVLTDQFAHLLNLNVRNSHLLSCRGPQATVRG
jgi:hypothetical protein